MAFVSEMREMSCHRHIAPMSVSSGAVHRGAQRALEMSHRALNPERNANGVGLPAVKASVAFRIASRRAGIEQLCSLRA